MGLKPTDEQQAVVDAYKTGENLVVEAAAGAGKTSTLRLIGSAKKKRRGLYLAFNKSIAMEAERKFAGTNVEARTANSVAFASHGRPYQHRLSRTGRMTSGECAAALGVPMRIGLDSTVPGFRTMVPRRTFTRVISETVKAFCRTDAETFEPSMVVAPPQLMLNPIEQESLAAQVLPYARKYWADVCDTDGKLPFEHDHYLKMWMLSKPTLDFDFIMLDEAQDADPILVNVLRNQAAQLITVGDRAQAIYGWRGATDAMDKFGGNIYQLTQSFRFGHAIAAEANKWLDVLGATLRVRGSEKPSSVHPTYKRPADAVLCRTNAGVIREIMFAHQLGIPVAIAGRDRANKVRSLAKAAKDLQENGWTGHPELDTFKSWAQVLEYVDEDEAADLAPFVKLVEEHTPDRLIRAIDTCVQESEARTVVSTAHSGKGLEWRHVRTSDDFFIPKEDEEGLLAEIDPTEAMLSYVAVTRAMRHLDNTGLSWLDGYRRAFERPELGTEWRRRWMQEAVENRDRSRNNIAVQLRSAG